MSMQQSAIPIPAHVPPELVHNIGLVEGPEFLANPHRFMADLHDRCPPIFYSVSQMGGFGAWHLIKHSDAFFMLRDTEYFTNEGGTPFPRDPSNPFKLIPIEIEPPEHRKYRNILDPLFSPQGIQALEGTIRNLACDLIDRVIDEGGCEFTKIYEHDPGQSWLGIMVCSDATSSKPEMYFFSKDGDEDAFVVSRSDDDDDPATYTRCDAKKGS